MSAFPDVFIFYFFKHHLNNKAITVTSKTNLPTYLKTFHGTSLANLVQTLVNSQDRTAIVLNGFHMRRY